VSNASLPGCPNIEISIFRDIFRPQWHLPSAPKDDKNKARAETGRI
jgi:hypothetical protein